MRSVRCTEKNQFEVYGLHVMDGAEHGTSCVRWSSKLWMEIWLRPLLLLHRLLTSDTASCDSIDMNLVESDCIEFCNSSTEQFSVFFWLLFAASSNRCLTIFSRQSRYMDITSQSTATMSEPRFTETWLLRGNYKVFQDKLLMSCLQGLQNLHTVSLEFLI